MCGSLSRRRPTGPELPVFRHNRGFYLLFCSKVQPLPGGNVFLVRQCLEGVTLGGANKGKHFFFVDLGVNQEFLIAANLMAFSPLKHRWPWIQWPFVGFVALQRLQRGGEGFSSTADHLTLARPRMCKAPIGNELPPQLIKGLNNNAEKTWRKTGGY